MRRLRMNQKGVLTFDFIFAIFLGMAFTIVFFAITMTLSVVEVTQYLSYSVARSAYAARSSRNEQIAAGKAKYGQLMGIKVFRYLYSQGWFQIGSLPEFGDPLDGFNAEYQPETQPEMPSAKTFIGARLSLNAKILHLGNGSIGQTAPNAQVGQMHIQTFLSREVNTDECMSFNRARIGRILSLSSDYQVPGGNVAGATISDNGC